MKTGKQLRKGIAMKKHLKNLTAALINNVTYKMGILVTVQNRTPFEVLCMKVVQAYKSHKHSSKGNISPLELLNAPQDMTPEEIVNIVTDGNPELLYHPEYNLDHICPLAEANNAKEAAKLQCYLNLKVIPKIENSIKGSFLNSEGKKLRKELLGR
jgi:hypothetical protein